MIRKMITKAALDKKERWQGGNKNFENIIKVIFYSVTDVIRESACFGETNLYYSTSPQNK